MEQDFEIWRLFVAISLPERVKIELIRVQKELQSALQPECIRWSRPEGFHLTLKFLGNVESTRVPALAHSLNVACKDFPVMTLRAAGVGFFPADRAPRVIWAGLTDAAQCLPLLQQAVEDAAAHFSAEKAEGKFVGHITLGRCPRIHREEAKILGAVAKGMFDRCFGEWQADQFELVRSKLSAGGSQYTTLATIPLAEELPFGTLPPDEQSI